MAKISLSLNDLSEQQRCEIFGIVEEALIDDSEDTESEKPFNYPEHLSPPEQARHWEISAGHSQYAHRYLRDRHEFYQGETKKFEDKIEGLVKSYQDLLMQNGYDNSDLAKHWSKLMGHYESMKAWLYHWNRALEEYTEKIQEEFEKLEESFKELSGRTNTKPEIPSQAGEKVFAG